MIAPLRSARPHPPLVERFAPGAPQPIRNESVIRVAGWLFSPRKPQPAQSVAVGSGLRLDFRERFYDPSALRNSGARALLTPWRTRRALPVEETP